MSDTPVAPIQFGAPAAAAPAPVAEPETPAVEQAAETLDGAVAKAEQAAETEIAQAETAAHTHETILSGLFTDLEGFMNMGKSEVYAVVQRWHGEFKKL